MTVVMSKLKQFGDHYNIPHNYVTRSVSCAIFALYFYKIGGPLIRQTLGEIKKKARRAQDNITGCDGNPDVADPTFIAGIAADKSDINAQRRTKGETYINFGPRKFIIQRFYLSRWKMHFA